MALGKKIKELREYRKLSQEELSALTDGKVSQGAISALEKRDSAKSKHAELLAEALNVSLYELHGSSKHAKRESVERLNRVAQKLPDWAIDSLIQEALNKAEFIEKANKAQKNNGQQ